MRTKIHFCTLGIALSCIPFLQAAADIPIPQVSVGAGMRTSFTSTQSDAPGVPNTDDFAIDSVRIYLNGTVTDMIKFQFDTEYDGVDHSVNVIDAIAQFHFSDQANIWAGRFLPPVDRSNLYGPYYANHWGVYQDGVQDGYPNVTTGRDDGVAYWGQFGIFKVSAGIFDVPQTKGSSSVLWATRVMADFWDPEPGYYLNGTYYGDKDIFAIGVAAQGADTGPSGAKVTGTAFGIDLLVEKRLPGAGTLGFESEWQKYDKLGGYYANPVSYGYYGLVTYLFPQVVGIGKFQLGVKYGQATADADEALQLIGFKQKTTEADVNYIIKAFNARISLFYLDKKFDSGLPSSKQFGVGLQLQM